MSDSYGQGSQNQGRRRGKMISIHGQTLVRRDTRDALDGFLASMGRNGPLPRMRNKITMGQDFQSNKTNVAGQSSGRSSRLSSSYTESEPTYFDRFRFAQKTKRTNGRLALITDFGR